jgi:cobalamin biosynthesis protein CobT
MAKNETFDSMLSAWVESEEEQAEEVNEETSEEAEENTEAEAEEVDTAEDEAEEEGDPASENSEEESAEEAEESEEEEKPEEEAKPEAKADEEDNKAKESSDREARIRASMQADIDAYNKLYPNDTIEKIDDIPNAIDFARMRRGGMSVEEAARYVRASMRKDKSNGKEHIKASSSVRASSHGIDGMTNEEYAIARDLFGDMPKKELESLFKRTRSK